MGAQLFATVWSQVKPLLWYRDLKTVIIYGMADRCQPEVTINNISGQKVGGFQIVLVLVALFGDPRPNSFRVMENAHYATKTATTEYASHPINAQTSTLVDSSPDVTWKFWNPQPNKNYSNCYTDTNAICNTYQYAIGN